MWLRIENSGEIELPALQLVGASTKRDDNTKIGWFGLGWKQAIACFLRWGVPIRIFSGLKEIALETREVPLRGKTFNQIVLVYDGTARETGITTDLAVDWQPWMAMRELVANALDEGGYNVEKSDDTVGEPGKTRVYVEFKPEIAKVWEAWPAYFRHGDAAVEGSESQVGRALLKHGKGVRVYKQGILVWDNPEMESIWDYDLNAVLLGEDRRAEPWGISFQVQKLLDLSATEVKKRVVRQMQPFETMVLNNTGYSSDIKASNWVDVFPSGAVLATPDEANFYHEELQMHRLLVAPRAFVDRMTLHKETREQFKRPSDLLGHRTDSGQHLAKPTAEEKKTLRQACRIIRAIGVEIEPKAIKVFTGGPEMAWGMVDQDEIWIKREAFQHGMRMVVKILLEEYTHKKTHALDKTREMQNALLDLVVQAIEKKRRCII